MAERIDMEAFARTEKLKFRYSDSEELVLEDLDVSFKEGELTAVLGHNGCGKSTLAKHLNAILLPSGGAVYVDGIDTADESKTFDVRQRVGMVFQNPDNQLVASIVEEDVAFALENLGVEPAEIRKRVDEALKAVDMYEYRRHSPHQLSGGQKQRIAIAGIIAMRPKCIVMDEPTAMLDPVGRKEIMETVKRLNSEYGITIIMITHYMEEAAQCRRVIVMDNGRILLDDTPENVFSQVGLMKSVGLDVPQVTELVYELKRSGIELDSRIITEEQCADAIFNLLAQ